MAVPSAPHRAGELVNKAEERLQPGVRVEDAVNDSPAGLHNLGWDREHRSTEGRELHAKELRFLRGERPAAWKRQGHPGFHAPRK